MFMILKKSAYWIVAMTIGLMVIYIVGLLNPVSSVTVGGFVGIFLGWGYIKLFPKNVKEKEQRFRRVVQKGENINKLLNLIKRPTNIFYQIIFLFWAIELFVLFLFGQLHESSSIVFTFICMMISILFFTKYKLYAMHMSKVTLLAFWIFYGWHIVDFVTYNLYQFSIGHERYMDSPGTILVVFAVGFFTLTFPTLLVLSLIFSEIFTSSRKIKIECQIYFNKIKIDRILNFLTLNFLFLYLLLIVHEVWHSIYITSVSMLFIFILSGYFVERFSSLYVGFIFKNFKCENETK